MGGGGGGGVEDWPSPQCGLYGDVPLDWVRFFTSLSYKTLVHIISCEFVNRVLPAQLI